MKRGTAFLALPSLSFCIMIHPRWLANTKATLSMR